MSQQHDLRKFDDPGSEPDVEGVDGEQAGVEHAGVEQARATSGDRGVDGWSGRAIGPLSGLLPGGAVDLTADEMPVEQSEFANPAVQAGDRDSVSAAAGTNGDEAAADVPAGDQKPAASAVAGDDKPSASGVIDDLEPTAAAGADDHVTADGAAADDREPASVFAADEAQPAEAVQATARTELDREDTGDCWHSVLVGFVDDPRGSVEAARALIDEDVAAHIALLARRREAMHAAWQANKDADTEALRVALVHYRDLRNRLASMVAMLTG